MTRLADVVVRHRRLVIVFWLLQPGLVFEHVPFLGIVFYLWFGVFNLLAVVQCCWLDELTTSEASQALGVPQGTVKTRLMRARIRLREELGYNLRKELA